MTIMPAIRKKLGYSSRKGNVSGHKKTIRKSDPGCIPNDKKMCTFVTLFSKES